MRGREGDTAPIDLLCFLRAYYAWSAAYHIDSRNISACTRMGQHKYGLEDLFSHFLQVFHLS